MATILVIEDERTVLEITTKLLEILGHRCLAARTGREALDIAAHTPDIDLVLLDRTLPDMDGMEVVKAANFTAPVILCSGDTTDVDDIRHHFAAILTKPYTVGELQAVLVQHLPS